MIQKKSIVKTIKHALQTGAFNYIGQDVKQIPPELFKIDQIPLEGQNWWECVPIVKMDFSNNQITQVPEQILMFKDLQHLRMKNNHLQQLPKCLHRFQTFKSLDASRNKLNSIPKEIAACLSLVELIISQNSIVYLPDFSGIQTLQHLIINQNKIKMLPPLGKGLRKVEASSNMITQIDAQTFRRCEKLEILTLNKNGIERIEKGAFSQTKSMVVLQLKENRLTTFKEAPWSSKLDILALSFNRLTQFDDYDRTPNITVLILNDNKIKKLSPNIIKLKGLKTLDLSNNDLPDLPSEIGFINSLVRMQIEGNPLKAIRQNIRASGTNNLKNYLRDRMDVKQRQNLQKNIAPGNDLTPYEQWTKMIQQFYLNGQLVMRGMQLQQLHQLIFEKDIRVLNLNNNKITYLPEQIGRLHSLKGLYINQNNLDRLPNSLASLSSLQTIEAQHNKLTGFVPFQKPFFKNLHYLDISTNKISQIPPSVLRIPKLRTLMLCYNKLTDIQILWNPQYLPCLEILDVSSNQLTNISDDVFNKSSLNYLNIQNNNLSKIPTVLGFMKLLGLKIDGNPLKLIKRQVIDKGTVAIMDYLRNKHSGDPPIRSNQNISSKSIQAEQVRDEPYRKQIQQKPYQVQRPIRPKMEEQVESRQSRQQKQLQAKALQKQMKQLEQELQNGWNLNNWQRNQKKKKMQSLMIQRNKLLRQ